MFLSPFPMKNNAFSFLAAIFFDIDSLMVRSLANVSINSLGEPPNNKRIILQSDCRGDAPNTTDHPYAQKHLWPLI